MFFVSDIADEVTQLTRMPNENTILNLMYQGNQNTS